MRAIAGGMSAAELKKKKNKRLVYLKCMELV